MGRITDVPDFGNIIVAEADGRPVTVADVGAVEDSVQEPRSLSRWDDGPRCALHRAQASGENTIEVVEAVKERSNAQEHAAAGRARRPSRATPRASSTPPLTRSRSTCLGSLFAAIVVFFFIRTPRTLIAALAIPASIIATFTLMRCMDFTLNNMTLLALTLAVGIVIDDAIVVLENIFRYIEEKNCTPFEAAIAGARARSALAVMATTLSLVVIFLPVAFMTGYAGRFINPFGWTMAFAILVSMLVSFTLTPMLSSRFLKLAGRDWREASRPKDSADSSLGSTGLLRPRCCDWALDHRWVLVGIAVVLVLSIRVPAEPMVGATSCRTRTWASSTVHIDTPEGTSLEAQRMRDRRADRRSAAVEGVADSRAD